ncbi:hypothetical protein DFH06DRAFT_1186455, partial [Mycena polygramma]
MYAVLGDSPADLPVLRQSTIVLSARRSHRRVKSPRFLTALGRSGAPRVLRNLDTAISGTHAATLDAACRLLPLLRATDVATRIRRRQRASANCDTGCNSGAGAESEHAKQSQVPIEKADTVPTRGSGVSLSQEHNPIMARGLARVRYHTRNSRASDFACVRSARGSSGRGHRVRERERERDGVCTHLFCTGLASFECVVRPENEV